MKDLTELQRKLYECRRHSDNHRRSRDYHKEANAKLREEVKIHMDAAEYWRNEHSILDSEISEKEAEIGRWSAALFLISIYAIAMTVLFFWIVRQ